MKKRSRALFTAVASVWAAAAMLGCSTTGTTGTPDEPVKPDVNIADVYALAVERGYDGTLEDLIAAFKGDSAYDVAVANGYSGSESEWLMTLVGAKGNDGLSPHIGANGNWYVGTVNTGVKARGDDGKSAYEIWLANGHTGTQAQFLEWLKGERGEQGAQGPAGNGIERIEKTGVTGNVDTYTIYFTNGTTSTFTVTNAVPGEPATEQGTEGLAYAPYPDGSYGVSLGTADNMGDIVIPATYNGKPVKAIEVGAFRKSHITSVTIPDSVTSIGVNAFSDCAGLSIYYIGDVAGWCGISKSGEIMSSSATLYIDGKKVEGDLVIPNSVTSISLGAFYGCSKLTSITIPDSVKSIGSYAFYGCSNLTSITIPDSVKSIGFYAFHDCEKLTSVTLGRGIVEIDKAFDLYLKIQNIYYTGDIGSWCSIPSVNGLMFAGRTLYINNKKVEGDIIIPAGVTSIGSYAFYGCDGITSVSLPAGVTSIGAYAFQACVNLTNISIPDSVKSIGYSAFNGCNKLTYNEYGNACYLGNATNAHFALVRASSTDITACTVHSDTKFILGSAFSGCSELTSITIPNSIESIDNNVFYGCDKLTYNEYGNACYLGNTTNPYLVLVKASSTDITSCTIHNNAKYIIGGAFGNCTNLIDVTIPDGVTNIGRNVFYGCSNLVNITIPNSVKNIDDTDLSNFYNLFNGCNKLTYNEYDNACYIGNATNPYLVLVKASSANIRSCTIHSDTKYIMRFAFSNCKMLTDITIPDGMMSININAFYNCSKLTSITFEDPDGWWYANNVGAVSGSRMPRSLLSDPTQAAKILANDIGVNSARYLKRAEAVV